MECVSGAVVMHEEKSRHSSEVGGMSPAKPRRMLRNRVHREAQTYIDDATVVHAVPIASTIQVVRGFGHGLHATCNDNVSLVELDGLSA